MTRSPEAGSAIIRGPPSTPSFPDDIVGFGLSEPVVRAWPHRPLLLPAKPTPAFHLELHCDYHSAGPQGSVCLKGGGPCLWGYRVNPAPTNGVRVHKVPPGTQLPGRQGASPPVSTV